MKSSKNQLWLDAFYSVSLRLKAECGVVLLALEDLAKDGADRLVTLLVGEQASQLKIIHGTDLQCEIVLPQMAMALCTFRMDGSLPAIAIGAGSSLYIYKNFKPYYKYTIPQDGVNYTEEAKIVYLTALPRSSPDVSVSSLLLIGTEHQAVLIIDPHTFTAISRIELPSIPVSIKCSGYYDVEAFILIVTDDARLLTLKSNQQPMEPKPLISMESAIVDVAFNGSVIAVATSDHSVKCYTSQGQEMRKISLDTFVLSLTWIEMKHKDLSLLAIALADGSVLFYRQGVVIQQLHFSNGIISMVYGRFGREDGVLAMVSKEGDLAVKILNRAFKLSAQNPSALTESSISASAASKKNNNKQLWPAKTKIFVDQALREQEDPKKMYQDFEEGLCRAHLRVLQEWQKISLKDVRSYQPSDLISTEKHSIHLVAKLSGSAGTRRQLQLLVQNTTNKQAIDSLTVMIHARNNKMMVDPSCREIGLLLPASQQWITVNVLDPGGQGGQLAIIFVKDEENVMSSVNSSSMNRSGHVIYSAKVEIAPSIM